MMDLDQWQERAAIMEFDGGMTRYAAETAAAGEQGRKRWEFTNADSKRNSAGRRDNRSAGKRNATDDVSRVQRNTAEQDGQMPIGDVQAGRRGLELLALPMDGGAVL